MFCKNCGKEIPDNIKFCPECGCTTVENTIKPTTRIAPNNYMILGILTTIFCCLPFGIASIIYASRVDGYWNAGNYDAALNFSQKAKNFAIWGIVLSIFVYILVFAFYGAVLFAALDM